MPDTQPTTTPPGAPRRPLPGRARRTLAVVRPVAGILVIVAVIVCLGRYGVRNWDQITALATRRELGAAFLLGSCCALLGYLLRGALWALIRYEVTGLPMSPWRGFHVSSISGLGRYVPGRVWSFAGKAYMSSDTPADIPGHMATVILDNLLFQAALGVYGGAILLLSAGTHSLPRNYVIAGWAAVAITLIAAEPRVFLRLANAALRLSRCPRLVRTPRYSVLASVLLGNMVSATFWAGGFLVIVRAIAPLTTGNAVFLVGLFCMAWLVGFFMVVAPAGIGVRDTILMLGLQQTTALSSVEIVTIVVAARLMSTFTELLCAAAALAVAAAGKAFRRCSKRNGALERPAP